MKFTIYVKNKFNNKVTITRFDPAIEQTNLYSTYNEKITHNDNDQITFTFSINQKITDLDGVLKINPFIKYLIFGNVIYLETETNLFEFVITQIAPKVSYEGLTYECTCQDVVSYKWSRINLGYSYNTMERGGIKTIYEIATDILSDCGLHNWQIAKLNSHLYPNTRLKNEKITLNIENTNPYNALIEGLNNLNASMMVDYKLHKIYFYQKDRVLFSGYRYRPETNLRSLSSNYNIDELATILHVVGGTDEKDMNITLLPPMPVAIQNYLQQTLYNTPIDGFSSLIDGTPTNMFCIFQEITNWLNDSEVNGLTTIFTENGIQIQGQLKQTNSGDIKRATVVNTSGKRILLELEPGDYVLSGGFGTYRDEHSGAINISFQDEESNNICEVTSWGSPVEFTLTRKCYKIYLHMYVQRFEINDQIDKIFKPALYSVNNIPSITASYKIPGELKHVHSYTESPNLFMSEQEELKHFCTIADKIPSLGQFLYNFDFFKQNGILSESRYQTLMNIIEVQMRRINLKLKPITESYYNLMWDMNKSLINIEAQLEQINTLYNVLQKETNQDNIHTICNDIDKINTNINNLFDNFILPQYKALYGNYILLPNSYLVPEINDITNKIQNYINIRNESKDKYYYIQEQYKKKYGQYFDFESNNDNYDYDRINLESEITYYKNRFYTTLQMVGEATTTNFFDSDVTYTYKIGYDYLDLQKNNDTKDYIIAISYYSNYANHFTQLNAQDIPSYTQSGQYGLLIDLENQLQILWSTLYQDYADVIYESTYENADELNSVSLYNQAASYFESYHHPNSSYSVEVVNLDELEQIGTPNLKVNSRIRIYNKDLGLEEGTSYNGGEGTILNNISYTTNELVITSLNYELRKSAAMSITVERIIQHQTILQKLIKNIK